MTSQVNCCSLPSIFDLKKNRKTFNKRIEISHRENRPDCFHCETLYWCCATIDRIKRADYVHIHPTGRLYLCQEHSNEANEIFKLGLEF